jgi:hypothetical protein
MTREPGKYAGCVMETIKMKIENNNKGSVYYVVQMEGK